MVIAQTRLYAFFSAAMVAFVAACPSQGVEEGPPESDSCAFTSVPTFEEFERCTFREDATGAYIVDGDIPIYSKEELRRFYDAIVGSGSDKEATTLLEDARRVDELILHQDNGRDAVWDELARCDISYCVSTQFGARYAQVVEAMKKATAEWSETCGVRFRHVVAADSHCDDQSNKVRFDVRPISGQRYLARAFFPNAPRPYRNIRIDDSAFAVASPLTLTGILRHEVGHTLGFRHEHTRPEAGQCFEDLSWRPLTPYDSKSVMHYPQCGGTAGWALQLSNSDRSGSTKVYGPSDSCP